MNLPLVHSQDNDLNLVQTKWKSIIDPLLGNQLTNGHLIGPIFLSLGNNIINHRLGRKLQGWFPVGQNALSNIFDNQASNQSPELTLSLTSSAAVTVTLWVF